MRRLVALLSLVLAVSSCHSPFEQDDNMQVFRYNEASNITSLDPAYAKDLANIWPCNQLYNGLLQMDDSLHLKPCIARSYEVDSDGRKYTFHLRNDVFFHHSKAFPGGQGRKVTARDFVYSFNRIVDPNILSPGRWVFEKVDTAGGRYRI